MSGHSKWAKIKRQKGDADQKRGQVFTKLGYGITLAAREGGGDPETNFSLRLAIDKAKQANMPKDNIERAIRRGLGEIEGEEIEDVYFEAFGPEGVPMIIDCSTDNKNRTTAEIRKIIETTGGRMGDGGSVLWQFETKGVIVIQCAREKDSEKYGKEIELVSVDCEEVSLEILEIEGVEDLSEEEVKDEDDKTQKGIEILTSRENLAKVLKKIEELKFKVISAELVRIAKNKFQDGNKKLEKKIDSLVNLLEDHDDVQNVWVAI